MIHSPIDPLLGTYKRLNLFLLLQPHPVITKREKIGKKQLKNHIEVWIWSNWEMGLSHLKMGEGGHAYDVYLAYKND